MQAACTENTVLTQYLHSNHSKLLSSCYTHYSHKIIWVLGNMALRKANSKCYKMFYSSKDAQQICIAMKHMDYASVPCCIPLARRAGAQALAGQGTWVSASPLLSPALAFPHSSVEKKGMNWSQKGHHVMVSFLVKRGSPLLWKHGCTIPPSMARGENAIAGTQQWDTSICPSLFGCCFWRRGVACSFRCLQLYWK